MYPKRSLPLHPGPLHLGLAVLVIAAATTVAAATHTTPTEGDAKADPVAIAGPSSASASSPAGWTSATSVERAPHEQSIIAVPPWAPVASARKSPAVCLAPGSPESELHGSADEGSEDSGVESFQFPDGNRWAATATQGCCLAQGDPTILTYSFVPDGTALPGGVGEPATPSNLFAFLNGIYGSPAVWMPIFHQVFADWGERAGVTYVFQSTDDGAKVPDFGGALGIRGDVRIGGHYINGDGGTIAYNWYPSTGDMVLDTGDGYYHYTDQESLLLRNIIAHEHGHGLGLRHVCPLNQTKLMEPIATLGFDGPQHDDTLAANRGYGDSLEGNDTPGSAVDLGTLGNATVSIDGLSIDDDGDVDLFRFSVATSKLLLVQATPAGKSYLQGHQNGDGSCSAGSAFDSRLQSNLAIDLLAANGTTVLASADTALAGSMEQLGGMALPATGEFYLRVRGSANAAQLYDLDVTTSDAAAMPDAIFSDGFESGDTSAWTNVRDTTGQLSVIPSAALDGTNGLQITFGAGANSYVVDRSPDAEDRYRVRFWLDASDYVPPSETSRIQILKVFAHGAEKRWLAMLSLRVVAGVAQIQARVRTDDGGSVATAFVSLSAGAHPVEIDWRKSSSSGAADGRFELWIDDTSAALLTSLDNDLFLAGFTRMGALGASTAATGLLHLDRFESRRQSYIGP